jgi:glycosyltransferase involved in cell wall biosynthesis
MNVGLRQHGWRVSVLQLTEWAPPSPFSNLTLEWKSARKRERDVLPSLDGIAVHHPRVFTPRPTRLFPGDRAEREIRTLVSYCRSRADLASADIVLAHFLIPDGYHALGLARGLGIPSAAMGWGIDVDEWPRSNPLSLERFRHAVGNIDIPIACSQRMVFDANAFLNHPRSDWEVVYAGIDLEKFFPATDPLEERRRAFAADPALRDPNTKIAIMIASPIRLKGYLELLDAWKEIEPAVPQWQLVMTGFGGDLDIPKEIRSRALSRAHWLGAVSVYSLPELLRASDAFVLPSHYEGLSIALMEAMATGLPVITTDVGGHGEVVRSDQEGWLLPAGDRAAIRDAFLDLARSPEKRLRYGTAARQAAETIGTPSDAAGRLAAILEKHLEQGARRSA